MTFPCLLSLDSGALFCFPFRPGMHLFGSLSRRNPSQAARVPSELGTKVGGVTEQVRHSRSSASLSLSFLPDCCCSGLGEDMALLRVFTTEAGCQPPCCFPRSRTPHWALTPIHFASPCIPFLAYGSPLAAELGPCSSWGGETRPLLPAHSPASLPVPYDICRPDHSVLTLHLPVTASVREVMTALAHEDHWTKGRVLVKVNSAGGELCLWINSLP